MLLFAAQSGESEPCSRSTAAGRYGGFCDRLARRDFLTIGGMALGGLALPRRAAARSGSQGARSHKAIINVYLPGGPPHIDMWDLKPDAPAEIRGEYNPIKTNVPGIEICELFPKLAAMADKFVIIRSLADSDGDHDAYQCMTGRKKQRAAAARRLAGDRGVGRASSRGTSTRRCRPT